MKTKITYIVEYNFSDEDYLHIIAHKESSEFYGVVKYPLKVIKNERSKDLKPGDMLKVEEF